MAEKLRSSGIRPVSRPVPHAYPEPTPDPQLRGLAEESTTEQITLPGQSDNQSAPRTAHSRLHQLLRCEILCLLATLVHNWYIYILCLSIFYAVDPVREATPTIPAAWNTLKHDTENRMLPFEAYSHYTRVRAFSYMLFSCLCVSHTQYAVLISTAICQPYCTTLAAVLRPASRI